MSIIIKHALLCEQPTAFVNIKADATGSSDQTVWILNIKADAHWIVDQAVRIGAAVLGQKSLFFQSLFLSVAVSLPWNQESA